MLHGQRRFAQPDPESPTSGDGYDSTMLGSHLSVAGGLVNALYEAQRLKMATVQIFTANQRQWSPKTPSPEDVEAWRAELGRLGWTKVVSHAGYLINLASPDSELYRRSVDAMTREVQRCAELEIRYAVVHPGSHRDSGERAGLARIVKALDAIIRRTRGCEVVICLETTVGAGSQLGGRFEHLAEILDGVRDPDRVGTCLDTCHVTAAGYDLSTLPKARGVFDLFDDLVGLKNLHCIHINDSKEPIGSHRDRHAHIGDGHVGISAFRFIVNCPRLQEIPAILETKKGTTAKGTPWDVVNLRRLRRLQDDRLQQKKVTSRRSVPTK